MHDEKLIQSVTVIKKCHKKLLQSVTGNTKMTGNAKGNKKILQNKTIPSKWDVTGLCYKTSSLVLSNFCFFL